MINKVILSIYRQLSIRCRLPVGAGIDRFLIFSVKSPYAHTKFSCTIYSCKDSCYLDFFDTSSVPSVTKSSEKILISKDQEKEIFNSARSIFAKNVHVWTPPAWSARDHVHSQCFIEDSINDTSIRIVGCQLERRDKLAACLVEFQRLLQELTDEVSGV